MAQMGWPCTTTKCTTVQKNGKMDKVLGALARIRTQDLPVGQACYLKTSEDFMHFEVKNSDYNHK